MNNRYQSRKAHAKGDTITIDVGRLQPRNPNHGLPVNCYLCGTAHPGSGLARIQANHSTTHVPLCDACFADNTVDQLVVRKFLAAPELKIRQGGRVTTEQFTALADKPDNTEH